MPTTPHKLEMQPVLLTDNDNCISYVLKRGGYLNDPENNPIPSAMVLKLMSGMYNSIDLENCFEFLPYVEADLQPGDIVMWSQDERKAIAPTEITKEGFIYSHTIMVYRHVGIIEKAGTISDCTVNGKDHPYAKTVRMRRLSEIKYKPNWILKLRELPL